MKKTRKVFGIIAFIAVIGLMTLPLTGCGDSDSDTKEETKPVVATPTANPPAGTYTAVQSVTLTSTEGATIYYTTNGTAPTTSSTQYSTPISISTTTTLKAFAVKEGMDNSGILTAAYTIQTQTKTGTSREDAIELTMDKWADGDIPATGGEQWFKFTTAEAQTSAYIHFMDSGTLSGAYVQMYTSDGTATGDKTSLGISYNTQRTGLTGGTDYYINVTPSSNSYKGTYRIGVVNSSSSSTLPSITIPTTGVTELTANNTWSNSITFTTGTEQWYKFTPTTTTSSQNIHFDLGTQRGLYVQLYDSDGKPVGSKATIFGSTFNASRSVTANNVYYILIYYYSSGTYKMGINAASTPPNVTVVTSSATALSADAWSTNGNIATAGGEQWFSFSATAVTQYIHFLGDSLTDIVVRVYTADGTLQTAGSSTSNLDGIINRSLSRTLNVGTTYYIRITPYNNTSGSGTYKIGFNDKAETPVVETTMPTTGVVTLNTVSTWGEGNIAAAGGAQWYSFTSSAATGSATTVSQYIYFQAGTTLTDAYIQLYTSDGRMVGTRSWLYAGTYSAYVSRTISPSTQYYIKVTSYYSTGAKSNGAFKLGFGTSSTLPTP
jgi:hypothetical protein